ncbi:MAG: hypothetical protein ABI791_07640 [Acidobacteriota bacterium]
MYKKPKMTLYFLFIILLSSCSPFAKQNNDMKSIGPDVPANLVIYFKLGTTENEINQCYRNAIYLDRPDGRGEGVHDGFGSFLRLLPSQANGHDAIAITFKPNATDDQRRAIKEALESCAIVYEIFENVAPKDISN